jgi:bifunctional non-homologous end joining protein LigD
VLWAFSSFTQHQAICIRRKAASPSCWPLQSSLNLAYRCPKYRVPMFFIEPALPKLRTSPPVGDAWLHEVKFDGYRVQLHKFASTVTLYTKSGSKFMRKFPGLAGAVAALPVRSCVIDGELTACDAGGVPDFRALHFNSRDDVRCVWAFDLLYLNGKDLRPLPLVDRKDRLERLVSKVSATWLCYAETFADGATLLKAADRIGLEGIVSKKANEPYRSGSKCDWIKVKCPSWREANKERWRLFQSQ